MHHIDLPKTELLKEHILSFNTSTENSLKNGVCYYAFPQRGTTIGFFRNALIKVCNDEITISHNEYEKLQVVFLGKYVKPIKVRYVDYVEKFSIHFTELGVHSFFPNYFEKYAPLAIQSLPLASFDSHLNHVLSKRNMNISFMEEYLISRFELKKFQVLERIISEIWKHPFAKTKILAANHYLVDKTLNRQFKRYVGCTTSDFKRIVRFKKVVEDFFNSETSKNITKLCYDNDYYDTSHFYRQITKTTDYNPKSFFKYVKKMGLENHIYIFK